MENFHFCRKKPADLLKDIHECSRKAANFFLHFYSRIMEIVFCKKKPAITFWDLLSSKKNNPSMATARFICGYKWPLNKTIMVLLPPANY
jgi:hypothetical protein